MGRVLFLARWGRDEWALCRVGDPQPISLYRRRDEADDRGRLLARRGWRYVGELLDEAAGHRPLDVPGPG